MFRSIFKTIIRGLYAVTKLRSVDVLSTSPLKMVLKMDRNM